MIEAHYAVYYRRAVQLAEAMRLCQDDLDAYASAAALLAVHSAISYSDAVLIGLGSNRPRNEDHRDAVTALKRACTKEKLDSQGVTHLQRLLGAKSEVSYSELQLTDEKAAALGMAAERFQAWAERTLKQHERMKG